MMRKLFRKRSCRLLLGAFVVFCLYCKFNVDVEGTYFWRQKGRCHNSREDNDNLKYLVTESHEVLNELGVPHFLTYGTLWGAIRHGRPLAWDYDFDFGVEYDDIHKVSMETLNKAFAKRGIRLIYQYWAGNYKVFWGTMTGDLMIYKDYYGNGMMRRIGIESWVLFVHYRYYHQFPKSLLKRPLPKLKFSGIDFSVPRGGIEIQKYFYPYNWWKVVKPEGCVMNGTSTSGDKKS